MLRKFLVEQSNDALKVLLPFKAKYRKKTPLDIRLNR